MALSFFFKYESFLFFLLNSSYFFSLSSSFESSESSLDSFASLPLLQLLPSGVSSTTSAAGVSSTTSAAGVSSTTSAAGVSAGERYQVKFSYRLFFLLF